MDQMEPKPWSGGALLNAVLVLVALLTPARSFVPHTQPPRWALGPRPWRQKDMSPVIMMVGGWSGTGRVDDRYWWTENEYEIEVIVPVPEGTRKEAVLFSAGVRSVKLGLVGSTSLLLGGELKGRIALDGSYWSLEDSDEEDGGRQIRLLLEKKEGAAENAMDWRRVLMEETATDSSYGVPSGSQPWDANEYVEQMLGPGGVNLSMVDRTMFGSGGVMANVSKDSLQDYVKQGVMLDAVTRVPGSEEGLLPTLQQDEEDGTDTQ